MPHNHHRAFGPHFSSALLCGITLALCGITLALCGISRAQPSPIVREPVGIISPSGQSNPTSSTSPASAANSKALPAEEDDDYTPSVVLTCSGATNPTDGLVEFDGAATCYANLAEPTPDGTAVTVVLNDSTGHISFAGGDANNHLTLSLPGDTSVVPFIIYGDTKTTTYHGASIHAHENNVYTPIIGTLDVSVFYFKGDLALTKLNGYKSINKGTVDDPEPYFGPDGNGSVTAKGQVTVYPAGVDTSSPQIAKYKVGVVQNGTNLSYTGTLTGPYAVDVPGGVAGLTVSNSVTWSEGYTGTYIDYVEGIAYAPPTYGGISPIGTDSNNPDGPSFDLTGDNGVVYAVLDGTDFKGTYTYGTYNFALKGIFTDYTVRYNTTDDTWIALRQANWYLGNAAQSSALTNSPTLQKVTTSTDSAYVSGMVDYGTPAVDALDASLTKVLSTTQTALAAHP